MRHITYIAECHTHPAGALSELSGLDRTLLSWLGDLRQRFLMPGLFLVLGDDGLHFALGKGGTSDDELL